MAGRGNILPMRRVGDAERRARLALRHRLAGEAKASTPVEAGRAMVALHSTGAAAVFLAVWARTRQTAVAGVESALYEERTLVRMLGMRRTVFVVPVEVAPAVHAGCTRAVAALERRRLERFIEQGGIAEGGAEWLREAEEATLDALRRRGEALAAELASDVPQLKERLHFGAGKPWEGFQGLSTRVLWVLAADGRVVSGRPRGSWVSSQYRWAPVERWLPAGLEEIPTEEGRVELARLWLHAYGPGTAADLRWWAGWSARDTARALAGAGAVEVELEAAPGFLLPEDLDPVPAPPPGAWLLPALDSTVMGWADRSWFLGPHRAALFDGSGNAGPTVWWDGRVVGGWGQRAGGEVVYRLLEDPGAEGRRAIEAEAARLDAWLGKVRATPSFRTPLERELAG